MFRRQRLLALLLTTVALLPVGSVLVWAAVLRSDWYATQCAAALSEYVQLPAEIERVRPISSTERAYENVIVWLPQRRGEALRCATAIVRDVPTADDPLAYELELAGGNCEISQHTWLAGDYRDVLDAGLRPVFAEGGPRRVIFSDMRITLAHDGITLTLHGASGTVRFDNPEEGLAAVVCEQLGEYRSPEPIYLGVRFLPTRAGVRVASLELRVPELPLGRAGLMALADLPEMDARFAGTLRYTESPALNENTLQRVLQLTGRVYALDIGVLANAAGFPGINGHCPEMQLQELRFENGDPARLRFRGALERVTLARLLELLGLPAINAQTTVRVLDADLSQRGIHTLSATADVRDLDMHALVTPLEAGEMNGLLQANITDLRVDDNKLVTLRGRIDITTDNDATKWIDRTLLRAIVEQLLGWSLPAFVTNAMDERITYDRFGVRLEVEQEHLTLHGTHGEGEEFIITGTPFDWLFRNPRWSLFLTPRLDEVRKKLGLRTNLSDDPDATESEAAP